MACILKKWLILAGLFVLLGADAPSPTVACNRHLYDGRADGLPTVIAHRGSSGKRPEHTLIAYQLAIEEQADLIEPDLQLTSDGVLIALHDLNLNRVTNVSEHPEFATKARPGRDGEPVWTARDFTIEELRTLRVRHLVNGKPTRFDKTQSIATFSEVVSLVSSHNARHRSRVGICPELKDASGHQKAGVNLVEAFLSAARELKLDTSTSMPVVVQSFDLSVIEALRPKTKFPLAFLSNSRPNAATVARLEKSADILAVSATAVREPDAREWIQSMHQRGYAVFAWTYRDDSRPIEDALIKGIDGFFTDFPDVGSAVRMRASASVRE